MTKASIIEKKMMHPFFMYFPIEDTPSLLPYFPSKTYTSTLTSAYPPNLLQVSLQKLHHCVHQGQPVVDTHFRDTFSTNLTSLWAKFMYYIIFYSFKHGLSPCDLWEKLKKCGLESMGRFLSNFLHEPSPCVLLSRQGILVAPQAYEGGLIIEISI